MDDTQAMRIALGEAEEAARSDPPDVPVGAVIVIDGRVVGRGRNMVEATADPTAHAEMLAIRDAVRNTGRARLEGGVMYVTLEPCLMCAGAIVQARLDRVVYGCDDPKSGAVRSLYTALSDPRLNHRCRVTAGLLADEAAALLADFFSGLRDRA